MKKILVIAAHPDDELLGCGGTLLYYRKLGYKVKVVFLSDGESSRKQNDKISTFYKRRTPEQSKISLKDFKKKEAKYFYNLVRSLQHPYPIAFIECKNKTKLYLNKVSLKVK